MTSRGSDFRCWRHFGERVFHRAGFRRLYLECLESRRVLDAVTVSTFKDVLDGDTSSIEDLIASPGPDGAISLREAVIASNSTPGDDTIEVTGFSTPYFLTRVAADETDTDANFGDLNVADSTGQLTIIFGTGSYLPVIDGNSMDRVFEISAGASLVLRDLEITGGRATPGGGIWNRGSLVVERSTIRNNIADIINNDLTGLEAGGGIYSEGTSLRVLYSRIECNSAFLSGGGIFVSAGDVQITDSTIMSNFVDPKGDDPTGGGITIDSTFGQEESDVMISGTTISDNTAAYAGGGIYHGSGNLRIHNSTISGNSAPGDGNEEKEGGGLGGGIYKIFGNASVANSTIAKNSAVFAGGVLSEDVLGTSALELLNTIIADNLAPEAVDVGGTFASLGNNLIGQADSNTKGFVESDLVGTPSDPINPVIGPLENNGGPTLTHALLKGSPALDAGNSEQLDLEFDQRGYPRIVGDDVDIGAFEDVANAIAGIKWEDVDADGVFDNGESPLAGWTIYIDSNGNNGRDFFEPSDITDEQGAYTLTNLLPGTYVVLEELQPGWSPSHPDTGNDDTGVHLVEVMKGVVVEGRNFGNYQPGVISGRKSDDLTGDGLTTDDVPLEGTTIKLYQDTNEDGHFDPERDSFVGDRTTDKGGDYAFTELTPARYFVQEEAPEGFYQTYGGNGGNDYYTIELSSGEKSTRNDFANARLGVIRGRKWNDENGNGIMDSDEQGLSGWTICLTSDFMGAGDCQLTGAGGTYEFTGVEAGRYTISETLQEGWAQTFPDGAFGPAQLFPTGLITRFVASDDLNGDTYADFVATNDLGDPERAATAEAQSTVSVLYGDGEGQFTLGPSIPVAARPHGVVPADVDVDGDIDLVVTLVGNLLVPSDQASSLLILLNNGMGSFEDQTEIPVGGERSGPIDVQAADLDNDGDVDLVASANFRARNVSILLNDGTGQFALAGDLPVGAQPVALAAVDLDGDEDIDLAVANFASSTVSLLTNDGSGQFQTAGDLITGSGPGYLTSGDIDNDGWVDLAVANFNANSVALHFGAGAGSFEPALGSNVLALDSGARPQSILSADLDADLDLDLAVVESETNRISVFYNEGNRAFSSARHFPVSTDPNAGGPESVVAGYFNGDGNPDLAATILYRPAPNQPPEASRGGVSVLLHEAGVHVVYIEAGQTINGKDFGNRLVRPARVRDDSAEDDKTFIMQESSEVMQRLVSPLADPDGTAHFSDDPAHVGGFKSSAQSRSPLDVNNDGAVTALDALMIITELNVNGARDSRSPDSSPNRFDVSGDNFISAIDALLVITQMPSANRGSNEVSERPQILAHVELAGATSVEASDPDGESEEEDATLPCLGVDLDSAIDEIVADVAGPSHNECR